MQPSEHLPISVFPPQLQLEACAITVAQASLLAQAAIPVKNQKTQAGSLCYITFTAAASRRDTAAQMDVKGCCPIKNSLHSRFKNGDGAGAASTKSNAKSLCALCASARDKSSCIHFFCGCRFCTWADSFSQTVEPAVSRNAQIQRER